MVDINAALTEKQNQLAALEAQAAQLTATVTDPNDPKLVEVDTQIEQTKAAIRRLERFAQGQVTQHSAAQLAERRAEREKAYTDAIRAATDRIPLAEKIDATFAKLGALLKQWDELGIVCQNNAAAIHGDDAMPTWQHTLTDAARGNNSSFTGAMEWALHKHQIGNVGIYLPWEQRRPIGESYTMAEAATGTAENLRIRLHESLVSANEKDL